MIVTIDEEESDGSRSAASSAVQVERESRESPQTRSSERGDGQNNASSNRIARPGLYDILCGKDKGLNRHFGNRVFRSKIIDHTDEYMSHRSKLAKMKYTQALVLMMNEEFGARFLRKLPDGEWVELTIQQARDKVSHALRFAQKRKTHDEHGRKHERFDFEDPVVVAKAAAAYGCPVPMLPKRARNKKVLADISLPAQELSASRALMLVKRSSEAVHQTADSESAPSASDTQEPSTDASESRMRNTSARASDVRLVDTLSNEVEFVRSQARASEQQATDDLLASLSHVAALQQPLLPGAPYLSQSLQPTVTVLPGIGPVVVQQLSPSQQLALRASCLTANPLDLLATQSLQLQDLLGAQLDASSPVTASGVTGIGGIPEVPNQFRGARDAEHLETMKKAVLLSRRSTRGAATTNDSKPRAIRTDECSNLLQEPHVRDSPYYEELQRESQALHKDEEMLMIVREQRDLIAQRYRS